MREHWGANNNKKKPTFNQLGNSQITSYICHSYSHLPGNERSSLLENLLRQLYIPRAFRNIIIGDSIWSIGFSILLSDLAGNRKMISTVSHLFSNLTVITHTNYFTLEASFMPWRDTWFMSSKAKLYCRLCPNSNANCWHLHYSWII